jgi:hypothetical protein
MKCGEPAGPSAWLLQNTKVTSCATATILSRQFHAQAVICLWPAASIQPRDCTSASMASMHMRTRSIISSICHFINLNLVAYRRWRNDHTFTRSTHERFMLCFLRPPHGHRRISCPASHAAVWQPSHVRHFRLYGNKKLLEWLLFDCPFRY